MLNSSHQSNNDNKQQRIYMSLLNCKLMSSNGKMPRALGCHVFRYVEKTDGITKLELVKKWRKFEVK